MKRIWIEGLKVTLLIGINDGTRLLNGYAFTETVNQSGGLARVAPEGAGVTTILAVVSPGRMGVPVPKVFP